MRTLQPSHFHRHGGFTLLELAIVLVIIGLLVGGLMGARAYVRSAQLTTMVNESKLLINAFGQFQTMYNAPPGDMQNADTIWNGAGDGDGNGLVDAGTTANPIEIFLVFQHLALAGMTGGHYTGASTGAVGTIYAQANVNIPPSAINHVAYYFDHPADNPLGSGTVTGSSYYFDSTVTGLYNHVFIAAGQSATANGLPDEAFLTPTEAQKVDAKFDDGVPTSGWILTPNTLHPSVSHCTATKPDGSIGYQTGYGGVACFFIMRLQ